MPNADKVGKVRELAERFRSAQGALFSDFRGLTVKDAMDLRTELRKHDASFVVAKNTLTKLAAREAGMDGVDDLLQGPTGIVFADGDPIAGAKAFMEVARRFPALVLKGAYLEGHVFGEEQAKGLATIEAREVSLAKVAGLLQAPLSRIAYLLQAPIQRLAYALAERGKQGSSPEPEASAAPEAEPPAEPEAGAPTEDEQPAATEAPEGSAEPSASEPAESAEEESEPAAEAEPESEPAAEPASDAEPAAEPESEPESEPASE